MTDRAADLQRQIDELVASVTVLTERANASQNRADGVERRANVSELRANAAEARADQIEARSAVDREMIAELQADGVVSQEHVAELESALVTSRTIGAALGMLMASRNIGQDEALTVLRGASNRSNLKMGDLAERIVRRAHTVG